MITVNLNKAKEITKDRLREERKPILESLDVLYIKAQEQNQDTAEIVDEKQRLRDITLLVDPVEDLEELKQLKVESTLV